MGGGGGGGVGDGGGGGGAIVTGTWKTVYGGHWEKGNIL